MRHALAYILSLEVAMVNKVYHPLNINRRFIGRSLQHVRLMVEVAVTFRIYKRYATTGILTILQRLDMRDATAMTTQAAHGKHTLVEHTVEFLAKQFSMKNHIVLYTIFINIHGKARRAFGAVHLRVPHVAHDMEESGWVLGAGCWVLGIVFSQPVDKAVKAMPRVYLGYGDDMDVRAITLGRDRVLRL